MVVVIIFQEMDRTFSCRVTDRPHFSKFGSGGVSMSGSGVGFADESGKGLSFEFNCGT